MATFSERQIIAGKYRLERPLAKGGMGSVWVGRNLQLDVPVALKFMAADAQKSAELVARFEREAKAAAQLRSPHVVHIYEHGVVEGVPFMAMELLEGEDLSKRLRVRGRLSMAETAAIVVPVCKALRRAHEAGIVHRDLKPGNVFLCRHDDEEIVKVLDFGIAKVLSPSAEEDVTKTGALVGTPHYMSPEQARRTQKEVDHRTDLWALGVIAFRALTGKLPFSGETQIDVLLQVCSENEPIPAPSSIAPDLGPEVDRFFARALARRPEARFQSARDFAEAFSALAARGTPQPSLGSSWYDSGANAAAPTLMTYHEPEAAPPRPATHDVRQSPPRDVRQSPPRDAPAAAPGREPPAVGPARVHTGSPQVYTSPQPPPAQEQAPDPLDIAQTVPLTRAQLGAVALRPAAAAPPATGAVDKRITMQIAPVAAAFDVVPPPRPSAPDAGGWGPQPGSGRSSGFLTVSGETAGTLTGAGTETPPAGQSRRSSWVIWVAAASVVVVIAVVGWAVTTAAESPAESGEPVPTVSSSSPRAPVTAASSATAAPSAAPSGTGTASSITPGATATAPATSAPVTPAPATPAAAPSASATVSAAAAPPVKPTAGGAKTGGAGTATAPPKGQSKSGLLSDPTF